MKRSLKALLAIAASSATTFTMTAPSIAASFAGDDEQMFTGIYAQQLEATRSCTINVTETAENPFGRDFDTAGRTIRLYRKSGGSTATGSVKVTFEAAGANAVFFENYQDGTFEGGDIDTIDTNANIEGSIKVNLVDPAAKLTKIDGELRADILDQMQKSEDDVDALVSSSQDRLLASVVNGQVKGGILVGGQSEKGIKNKDLLGADNVDQLGGFFERPVNREAVLKMEIDVDKLDGKNAIIQARLVCAPLIYDDDGIGTIRPN